jgi:hypothetical protein
MNNLFTGSIFVGSRTIADFNTAFSNLRPKVEASGNRVKITNKGQEYNISLTQTTKSQGFTR